MEEEGKKRNRRTYTGADILNLGPPTKKRLLASGGKSSRSQPYLSKNEFVVLREGDSTETVPTVDDDLGLEHPIRRRIDVEQSTVVRHGQQVADIRLADSGRSNPPEVERIRERSGRSVVVAFRSETGHGLPGRRKNLDSGVLEFRDGDVSATAHEADVAGALDLTRKSADLIDHPALSPFGSAGNVHSVCHFRRYGKRRRNGRKRRSVGCQRTGAVRLVELADRSDARVVLFYFRLVALADLVTG